MAKIIDAIRRRRAERAAASQTTYWDVVERLAHPRKKQPDAEEVDALLDRTGISPDQLEEDVRLVAALHEADQQAGTQADEDRRRKAREDHAGRVEAFRERRAKIERELREEGEALDRQGNELAAEARDAIEARSRWNRLRRRLRERSHGVEAVETAEQAHKAACNAEAAVTKVTWELAAVEQDLERLQHPNHYSPRGTADRLEARAAELRRRRDQAERDLAAARSQYEQLAQATGATDTT